MVSISPGVNPRWVKELTLHTAVTLDLLVQRQRLAGKDNWFKLPTAEMREAIGITHFSFKNARRKLVNRGYIEERDIPLDAVNGTPRRIEYRVDLEAVKKIGAR